MAFAYRQSFASYCLPQNWLLANCLGPRVHLTDKVDKVDVEKAHFSLKTFASELLSKSTHLSSHQPYRLPHRGGFLQSLK